MKHLTDLLEFTDVAFSLPVEAPTVDILLSEPIKNDAGLAPMKIRGRKRRLKDYLKKTKNYVKESVTWQDALDQKEFQVRSGKSVKVDELVYSEQYIKGHVGETSYVWDATGKCLRKESPKYLDNRIGPDDDLQLRPVKTT